MTSAPLVLALLLLAAAPAPGPSSAEVAWLRRPTGQAVLGASLRPGSWGWVRLTVGQKGGAPFLPGLGQLVRGSEHRVLGAPMLDSGVRSYLIPFRPMIGAGAPGLVVGGQLAGQAPDLVGPEDGRLAAVVGRLPVTVPAGLAISQVDPAELPEYPAAYEGLDVLVIGELDGAGLTAVQRQALKTWFRGGGKVFIVSAAARAALADVFFGRGLAGQGAVAWDQWKLLTGAADADVAAWAGEGAARAPLAVRFRVGFGRGAYLWPAAWTAEEGGVAWSAYNWLLESGRQPPAIPAVDKALYQDFPRLRGELFGAEAALRWALGVALALSAAGAVCWRRSRPWRFAGAVAAAALVAAVLVAGLARLPEGRALSVRIDEFSSDGAGVRARQLLYLERSDLGWQAEVRCARGVLPSAVLAQWEEGGEFASTLRLPAPGTGDGPRLAGLGLGPGGGLLVGAGPLPMAAPLGERPADARALGALRREACIAAVADCLSAANGRCRAQAETLAGWIWQDLESRGLLDGAAAVYVCRLPEEAPALVPAGRVQAESLGRLGIFFSGG